MLSGESISLQPDKALKRFIIHIPEALETFPHELSVTDASTVHHLRNVIRAKPSERLVIVDDCRAVAYEAVIQALEKDQAHLLVEKPIPASSQNTPVVTLGVGLIKEQRWDWLLQKTTELGVYAIQPLITERSVIRLSERDSDKKQARWQAITRSAAEQSEGFWVPSVHAPVSVAGLCEQTPPNTLKLFLKERGTNRRPLPQALSPWKPEQSVCVAIGSEGGWTESETHILEQAGFLPVSLGDRILRSETAAIAVMMAVLYESLRGC